MKGFKKNILVITRNTDTFNNPVLYSLFHHLGVHEFRVLLVTEHRSFFKNQFPNVREFKWFKKPSIENKKTGIFLFELIRYYKKSIEFGLYMLWSRRIIGVDPPGIIWAYELCKKIPIKKEIDYFSFEIYGFSYEQKHREIIATNNIRNLIIQDKFRETLLCGLNKITTSVNTFHIPVSISSLCVKTSTVDSPSVRHKYSIPPDIKMIVFFGSFSKWSGADILLEIFEDERVFENNAFLIHSRYPLDIEKMGLSSGKFSMFMAAGLPTITTAISMYPQLNNDYSFGFVVNGAGELTNLLTTYPTNIHLFDMRINCLRLFSEKLDIRTNIEDYIEDILG